MRLSSVGRESRYCLSTEIVGDDDDDDGHEEDAYFLERTSRFEHALTFRLWPEIAFVFLVVAFEHTHTPPSSFEIPNFLQDSVFSTQLPSASSPSSIN